METQKLEGTYEEQEEASDNISNILAKQKQKEHPITMPWEVEW